ncbi:hypothetical protein M595_3050 [Lyngbya aestuarii BL J]|uniref:Uncharacterized protein n=1 Tax=Lyngbya aestuarii BL J TaxID=1348334 RepID=U7QGB1_9CYAN|nr:hypothetical protein M595_3050 [Lyngbya aestuarii BL J]
MFLLVYQNPYIFVNFLRTFLNKKSDFRPKVLIFQRVHGFELDKLIIFGGKCPG